MTENESRLLRDFISQRAHHMRVLAPDARIFAGVIQGGKFSPLFMPWVHEGRIGDGPEDVQKGLKDRGG